MENKEIMNISIMNKIMPSNISSQAGIGFFCAGGVQVFWLRSTVGTADLEAAGFGAGFGTNGGVGGWRPCGTDDVVLS